MEPLCIDCGIALHQPEPKKEGKCEHGLGKHNCQVDEDGAPLCCCHLHSDPKPTTQPYTISEAVREITKVGVCPAPKSAVRKILERLLTEAEAKAYKRGQDDQYDAEMTIQAQTGGAVSAKASEAPMGVSQWMAHGKKYCYDLYFIDQAVEAELEKHGEQCSDESCHVNELEHRVRSALKGEGKI